MSSMVTLYSSPTSTVPEMLIVSRWAATSLVPTSRESTAVPALRSRRVSAAEPAFSRSRGAAVFVLFTIRDEQAEVLLMRRPRERGTHRGEWAFPGGVRESEDGGLLQTAFRETEEELGIPHSAISYWGGLEPVTTVGTRFEVWPFTGWLDPSAALVPSEHEVEEVASFPIETFTSMTKRRSIHLRRNGLTRDLRAYAHDGRVVWGATARILSQIFDAQESADGEATGEFPEIVGQ